MDLLDIFHRLHALARQGIIDADTAERHINAYLPTCFPIPNIPVKWLIMSVESAPHFDTIPDLGPWIRAVLTRCRLESVNLLLRVLIISTENRARQKRISFPA